MKQEVRLDNNYAPPFWLRPASVQTFLASLKLRARARCAMDAAAKTRIITTTAGVRLMGIYSQQPGAKGLLILLHGWEGSAESTYMRITGRTFFEAGYDLLRLNMRDHGASHHLNEGLFLATNLDEVVDAVRTIVSDYNSGPVFLAGFSLGGNFALRIAGRLAATPLAKLRHVVAVSPVVDPYKATLRIDAIYPILWYFRKKWCRSLSIKAGLYPDMYRFDELNEKLNLMQMTERFISRYSDYPDARTYLNAYGIIPEIFSRIRVPVTVITAADDPIIPAADLMKLPENPNIKRIITPHGGHNGFIEADLKSTYYEKVMKAAFAPF